MPLTIRGTGIQASSASSYTVSWPSGTQAGDLAIILVGHGWGANTPSGWTAYKNLTGTNWNGAVFTKILTSQDITAGSVTVSFAGSYDGVLAIITFVGFASIAEVDAQRNGSGSTSVTLNTSGAAQSTDLLVYFGSNRAASTDTVNSGTLQRQANDGANASGCLYTQTGVSGTLSRTFSYSVAGSGNYQAIVFVRATPPQVTQLPVETLIAPSSTIALGQLALEALIAPPPLPLYAPAIVAINQKQIIGIPEIQREPVVNVVRFRLDVNNDRSQSNVSARQYRKSWTFWNQASINQYQQQFVVQVESQGMLAARGGFARAFLLADRIFRRHAFGTPSYTFSCDFSFVNLELGDYFQVTHPLLLDFQTGNLGITNALCEIVEKHPNYSSGRPQFKVLDTRFMSMTTAWQIAVNNETVWPGTVQPAQEIFIAQNNGKYSDGTAARTLF
jgi:hypothetical protein